MSRKILTSGYSNGLIINWNLKFKKGTFKKASYLSHFWIGEPIKQMLSFSASSHHQHKNTSSSNSGQFTVILTERGRIGVYDQTGHQCFKDFIKCDYPINFFTEASIGSKKLLVFVDQRARVYSQTLAFNSGVNSARGKTINYGAIEATQNTSERKGSVKYGCRLQPSTVVTILQKQSLVTASM